MKNIVILATYYLSTLFLTNNNNIAMVVAQSNNNKTAVQTHFGDTSFASAMRWEPNQELLYLTGQVGVNACWMSILKPATMQFLAKLVLPEPAICQDLLLYNTDTVLLVADTEEGGLYTNTRVKGSNKATQYGVIVPVKFQNGLPSAAQLVGSGGNLMHQDTIQSPRAIVQDPNSVNYIYVASLQSESSALTNAFTESNSEIPNLTPGGIDKFGSQYFVQVERLEYDPLSHKLTTNWRKPFGLTPIPKEGTGLPHQHSVHLSTMIWSQGSLLLVGNTRGQGPAFGSAEAYNGTASGTYNDYCLNGFMSKVNHQTGRLEESTSAAPSVKRYSHGADMDTSIETICIGGTGAAEFYVAGYYAPTVGSNNSKSLPFLAKVDATTLETIWQESYVFTQSAFGVACGVDETSKVVYMAGIVENGGSYGGSVGTTSMGQDDVFVVRAQMSDGHGDWVRQIGTQGQDRLAHGGSGMAVLKDGNLVLFGDTTGDLQATNHKGTEVFVVAMNGETGQVSWTTTETSGKENAGGSVPIQVPKRTDDGASATDGGDGRGIGHKNDDRTPLVEQGGTGGGIGIIIAIVVLALVLVIGYIARSRKQERVTERAAVFSYLHAFDLEDIDVRHSATGGWHGSYIGDLANGKGVGTETSTSTGTRSGGRLSHSSIVRDSLFVDYETSTTREGAQHDADENDYDGEDDDRNHFRIEDDDDENIEDDPDFDAVGKHEDQFTTGEKEDDDDDEGDKPSWGRDIV